MYISHLKNLRISPVYPNSLSLSRLHFVLPRFDILKSQLDMAPYNETEVLERIDNQQFYTNSLGPFMAAIAFQMFMMGVLTLQTWTYFETMASEDSKRNRWLVWIMLFLNAFQMATNLELMYTTFVTGYGRILQWDKLRWTAAFGPAATVLTGLFAHMFFMHRCFVITRSYTVLVVCGMGAGLAFSAGIASVVALVQLKYHTRLLLAFPRLATWWVTSSATDVAISAILIFNLRKNKTYFPSTERMISRIIRLAIETASLTAAVTLVDTFLYAAYGRKNSAHFFFSFLISNLYHHSVIVTLLSRRKIRSAGSEIISIHAMSHSLQFRQHDRASVESINTSITDDVATTRTHVTNSNPMPMKPPQVRRSSSLLTSIQMPRDIFRATDRGPAQDSYTPTPSRVVSSSGEHHSDKPIGLV